PDNHRDGYRGFIASEVRIRCMPHTVHLSALELLEVIGAFKPKGKKGKGGEQVYQESVTVSLDRKNDDDAVDQDDGENEDGEVESTVLTEGVKMAILKLRKIIRAV
ncbi:hypothetical protein HWV62_38044, partial [Athelia sp. TMB]